MKQLSVFILLFISIMSAYPQDNSDWRMVGNRTILSADDSKELNLTANAKWVKINRIEKPFINEFSEPAPGYIRKWRIFSKYSDSDPSIKTSFQIKFMTPTFKRPTFSFTRPLGYAGELESFSDWFKFEDGSNEKIFDGDATIYARIISPPTTANSGKIFEIELQAWDVLLHDGSIKSAGGRALPGTDLFSSLNKNKVKTKEQATEFAMQVMSTVFNKDRDEFNELLADKCYSLENGTVYYKNNFPLYDNLKEITKDTYITLASYQKNYKPQLISFNEYSEMFPHWNQGHREWEPKENDFLFLGNIMKTSGSKLLKTRMAVFMISFNSGRWQIKAIPE